MLVQQNKTKSIFSAPQLPFKKKHKKRIAEKRYDTRNTCLYDSTFGIKAQESAKITHKQNENLRRILVRKFKRHTLFFRNALLPDWPVSQKSRGTRMGKGKGPIAYWVNRLSTAKIGITFTIPSLLDEINFYRITYCSLSKAINYKSKLIINKHFLQETYDTFSRKLLYWKVL